MDCKEFRELLPAYSEGIVPPEKKSRIEQHLTLCRQCSAALEDLKKTEQLVTGLEEVEPPPWLKAKIMAHVREEAEQKGGFLSRLFYPLHIKIPLQALATILIVGLTYQVYRTIEPQIEVAKPPSDLALVSPKAEPQKPVGRAGSLPPSAPRQALKEKGEAETSGTPSTQQGTGITLQEERPALSPPAEEPRAAKGEKGLTDRHEEELKAVAAPQAQKEAPQLQKARAREADSAFSAGPGSKDKLVAKAMPAAGEAGSLAGRIPERGFSLAVDDVKAASGEVEKALAHLGARDVTSQSRDGLATITAVVSAERVVELLVKIRTMGEVKEKASSSPIGEGDERIKIEVFKGP